MESAIVSDKARVLCHAVITDEATICGEAVIGGNANISDSATVYGKVMDYVMVYGNARVNKSARISNHAIIYNNACINGKVGGSAVVAGVVYGSVKGSCTLGSDVIIGEDVDVSISEKLALENNDDFVYVRCGSCMSNQKTGFLENSQIGMNLRELKR
jgi:UDP-3-O-[3-hydroxymyristoyl] glucosamine N-acyltransferase